MQKLYDPRKSWRSSILKYAGHISKPDNLAINRAQGYISS